jgi:transcriptional regulator with XRE-family HTH domain
MQKTIHSTGYKHLLTELKEVRTRVGVSQVELASRLDVHQTFVSKCEIGLRRLDVIELRQWVLALGVNFPEFIADLDQRLQRHRAPSARR